MKPRAITVLITMLTLLSAPMAAIHLPSSDADASGIPVFDTDSYSPPDSGNTFDVPERFDMRDVYGELPVRDQGRYNMCWSHAACASSEYLMKRDAGSWEQLSPWYHAYNTYSGIGYDRIGDGDEVRDLTGKYPNTGGYSWASLMTVLDWRSPLPERLAPCDGDLYAQDYSPELKEDVVRINGASFLNIRTDASSVKHKIMEGYAGTFESYFKRGCSMMVDGYLTMNTGHIEGRSSNHGMLLVGWDDGYPKENFLYPPSADGAWLVKNSYGENPRNGCGYVWVSYESIISDQVLFFDRMAADSEDVMYTYDSCVSFTGDMEFDDSATMANVFRASGRQTVTSVGLTSLNAAGFDYTIEVYASLKDVTDPTSGRLESVQKGRMEYAGALCVELDDKVSVSTGQTFSICVTFDNPGGKVLVPVDSKECWACRGNEEVIVDPIAHRGESFVLINGEWVDIGADGTSNVRIRAYADAVEESDAPVIAIAIAMMVAIIGGMAASRRR